MIEEKECIVCNSRIIVINCHYSCKQCGFSENCHDKPHLIDEEWYKIDHYKVNE